MQINHKAAPKEKCKAEIKKNEVMLNVSGMSPMEIEQYVEDNVNSVPDIKKFLVMLITSNEAKG